MYALYKRPFLPNTEIAISVFLSVNYVILTSLVNNKLSDYHFLFTTQTKI